MSSGGTWGGGPGPSHAWQAGDLRPVPVRDLHRQRSRVVWALGAHEGLAAELAMTAQGGRVKAGAAVMHTSCLRSDRMSESRKPLENQAAL